MTMATRFLPVTLLVAVTLAGCQLLSRKKPLGIPETALLPATSAIAITVRTDWEKVAQAAPVQKNAWQAQVTLLKAGLLSKGIDYTADIQPWIGETATVAMTGLLPNSEDPGVVLVTTSRDPQKSAAFVEKVIADIPGSRTQIPGGQLFIEREGSPQITLTIAQLQHQGQHFIAIANAPSVMDQVQGVLQNPKTTPPLSTHKPFLSLTQSQMDDQTWLAAHLHFPALIQTTGALKAFTNTDLDTPLIRGHLQGMQAMSFRTHWTADGVGMDYRIQVDPQNPWMQTRVQPTSGKILQRLPGNALAVMTTAYPAQIWQDSLARLETIPESKQMLAMARGSVNLLAGLDLDRDVIGWMDGEVALALVGDPEGRVEDWDGLIAIETSQKNQIETTWRKLDTLAGTLGVKVRGNAGGVVSWSLPELLPKGIERFWVDPYLVFTSSPALGNRFRESSTPRLPQSPVFASLLKSLPSPNYGYLLVDGSLVRDLATTAKVNWTAQTLWQSITAVGATSYRLDPATYAAEIRIQMKKD